MLNSQDYLWQPFRDSHDGCPDLLYMLCLLVIGIRLLFNAFLRFEGKGPFLPGSNASVQRTVGFANS